MTAEAVYLALVLLGALVLFYTGWVRTDLTALLVMLSLLLPWRPTADGLAPILEVQQGFAGFGSPAVVMVASMFVLSAAMVRTGAAQMLGGRILARAASERVFQLRVLIIVTLFSAVINDTTTVLVWMPLVIATCRERGWPPARILILLAYASLLGGQWTLIGTRSNIVVSDYLRTRTGHGLGFFSFTPIAVTVWGAVIAYFMLMGRRALPKGGQDASLAERYEVTEYLTEVMAVPTSDLIGKPLGEIDLGGQYDVSLLQVVRGREILPPSPWLRISADDVLVIQGRISKITDVLAHPGLQVKEELKIDDKTLRSADLRMVEAVVAPNTELEGKSLRQLDFHHRYGVSVLAINRRGRPLAGRPLHQRLSSGDSLLLVGHESELERLRAHPSFLLLESRALPSLGKTKAYLVLALMLAMVVTSATNLLQPALVIPLAAVLAILTGCIGTRDAYESIDLHALVVVGAMIPYGTALEQTGTAHRFAHYVAECLAGASPHVLFAALLLVTVGLTQLIENAAVAIVLSPVAYEIAVASGANPVPYLLGVAICVSSAFMTPVAHESTILVMGPGGYAFRDYVRIGAPFTLITWLVAVFVVPLFYPL